MSQPCLRFFFSTCFEPHGGELTPIARTIAILWHDWDKMHQLRSSLAQSAGTGQARRPDIAFTRQVSESVSVLQWLGADERAVSF